MARITYGLVGLVALSTAINMVSAHEGGHGDAQFKMPGDADYEKPTVELTDFKPSTIKAPFLEQFTSSWSERWTPSEATKESNAEGEVFSYVGAWNVEEPTVYPGMKGDQGLVVKTAAAHHAISASLPEVVDNKDKTLVVQYEVKAQNGLECGGAYMKLLTDSPDGIKFKEFSNDTPYTIMFGPDKCGATNKVHFIFRHKNPLTGAVEEKHLTAAPRAKLDSLSNLYTLIVKPDQTFDIKINNESVSTGTLLTSFTPSVNPPKEIEDPKDSKPSDWVDEAKIVDVTATKPAEWDEDAPMRIVDEKATKPSDWLEDEQNEIPDPEAVKPEDWDDEEDGDWIPVSVPNSKCQNVSGCGKWVRPTISNPAYKGKWTAPLIDNPVYKGVWAPRKIANPDFFEDLAPSNFDKIGAVGFEIWTMQNDILFDNIYIGHSTEDAEKLAEESWKIKFDAEKKQEEKARPEAPEVKAEKSFKEDPIGVSIRELKEFIEIAREDPMLAMNSRPIVVSVLAGVVGVSFGLFLIILGLMSGASAESNNVGKAKKTDAVTADDKEEKETKSSKGKSKEESAARKRTTAAASAGKSDDE
ncbi:hypothetical protein BGW38_001682 [Lunasporangiospora selenospora]|uniref:Calnexin n=1 Tax=Lunasporangiospora selenospora TaxID=979761 RepID=A0A9P6FV90_9FUNG|nr:hypothetical protein BGW38_001682 [Lunasporangiospora selenospora]